MSPLMFSVLAIFSAYPNPVTSNKLTLGFAIPENGNASISLSSINGTLSKKLFSADLAQGTYEKEFELNNIASGEYIISLTTEYGSAQKKIIIQK